MITSFPTSGNLQECRKCWHLLAFCCMVASGFGALFADAADDSYTLLMRMAASRPVSIVGLAVSVFVPFLVSFWIITRSKPWLVYFTCGVHVFSFTAVGWAICRAFASAGWLVRLLLQLPEFCLLPLLILLAVFRLTETRSRSVIVCSIVIIFAVGMVYYSLVSPFLADLIDVKETMGRYTIHVGLDRRL